MELFISLLIGIGLSAAAGFRLLVPFLALSLATLVGHFPISSELAWVGTFPALVALTIGLLLEVLAYYIPWLDHLLDMVTLPLSMLAGILLTAAFTTHLDPLLQWSLAIVAGGGAAAAAKAVGGGSRLTSTFTTGGFGNFIVETLELWGAIALSSIALCLPQLALVVIVPLLLVLSWQGYRRWQHSRSLELPA